MPDFDKWLQFIFLILCRHILEQEVIEDKKAIEALKKDLEANMKKIKLATAVYETNQEELEVLQVCAAVPSTEVGLHGRRVTCLPRDPRFAGSNPAEVDGFFQDIKIPPPGGTLSWGSRV